MTETSGSGETDALRTKLSNLAENLSILLAPFTPFFPISQKSFMDSTKSGEDSDWIMAAATSPEPSQDCILSYQGCGDQVEDRAEVKLSKLTPPTCRFRPGGELTKFTKTCPHSLLTGLGLLQPVNEFLHLLHEDSPALGDVPVLVPLEYDLLAQNLQEENR